jgi:GntR family transcriptional regulator
MGVITVDTLNRKPIYEQLVDNVRENVLRGTLAPGEQLPSVRALSGELAINPNTIQKAYMELERQGVIYSLPGRGSFISDNVSELIRKHREHLITTLTQSLMAVFEAGVDRSEVEKIIAKIWGAEK